MKLFGRTAGYYLFWTGFVYFWVGMYWVFVDHFVNHIEYIQILWLTFLILPLIIKPLASYFNMKTLWEI
jgi:hypothetical protein